MLATIYEINKFRHYIKGYPIFIHTYHTTIRYLMNKLVVGGRLVKWLLLLQEFDITIVDKLGKEKYSEKFYIQITNSINKKYY